MFHQSKTKTPLAKSNSDRLSNSKNVDFQLLPNSAISTVLIADEEPEVRDALSVAVRRWAQEEQRNVEPFFVENGQQAVDYVEKMGDKNPPFLAILDLRMPQMNGLESAQIISEFCPQIPIIITASHNEIDEKLIQKADDFANQNSHMGFIIRTNSSHLLKVALEFEIGKLEIPEEEQKEVNKGLLGNLKGKLSQILN
ncbi:Response regulator with CheY-like receiver, AAA-type ATPase, and DNA-binding domains [Hyella patelloides LEGE 07179]|uniref:Response regulator with CheY-like receiver, AAA-type ATPase, and DNA-binding domains n=1 Tax=Hyella patelloides LEGE 07179 TaxID=945734 RepID=A0A563W3H5_9CYAN|nr:response regulator [Hyella patelloides]VEP18236.1 Response regulator with CheY-like receiver, AAA-type ATPase, and DNA-binding domains [Hyella patelloides LEGE 07179]